MEMMHVVSTDVDRVGKVLQYEETARFVKARDARVLMPEMSYVIDSSTDNEVVCMRCANREIVEIPFKVCSTTTQDWSLD